MIQCCFPGKCAWKFHESELKEEVRLYVWGWQFQVQSVKLRCQTSDLNYIHMYASISVSVAAG